MFGKLFTINLLSVKFKKMEKEIAKSQNRTNITVAIIGLLGVFIGTFGMKYYEDNYGEKILPKNNVAYVEDYKNSGIYIFFRSRPHSDNYTVIGTVDGNAILRAIENAEGKKGLGNILKGLGNSVLNDLSFENRLDKVVEQTIKDYKGVEGIIFSKDLTKGEAIKF